MNQQDISNINHKGAQKEPFYFVINYKQDKIYTFSKQEAEKQGIKISLPSQKCKNIQKNKSTIISKIKPVSYKTYQEKIFKIQKALNYGYSYLINLTQPSEILTNHSIEEIYSLSSAKYKLLIPGKFVVFSPETFVTIKNNTIATHPMKGTIDASVPNAKEIILNSKKETAEHATIVDLLRNDLSRVAKNVRVEQYRYIEEIKTSQHHLLQVSSKITGKLPENWRSQLGNILHELLPAGSVTGAPKPETLKIIEEVEGYDRGFYTGIAGYFDGEKLDSFVLIRFIEQMENKLIYKSGGGITTQSVAKNEYNELIQKIYVPID